MDAPGQDDASRVYHQETTASGEADAFVAGRDIYYYAAASPVSPKPARIWGGVPARNPGFTGRESLLAAVSDALASSDRAVVQALHGAGGVGKTQLAAEYAHRHAASYDIVWWLNSENAALLGEQFAALAAELSCAPADASLDEVRRAVKAALHDRVRWLLIFDNAENPEDIAGWLPGGRGHVLITSRAPAWGDLAVPVEVDVFSRAESVETLRGRVPHLSQDDADTVAEAVGDLPLAVAQAAGYMALTGIPSGEYVILLRDRPAEIMNRGKPWSYPQSLAAATTLSFAQMRAEDPAAAEVAAACAFLAPEPVPAEWFPLAATHLPSPLDDQAADPTAWRQVIVGLRGSGLVRVNADTDALLMHRLTQAIIREHLSGEESTRAQAAAVKTLAENRSGDEELPANWPAWARMLPHLLALDPANSDDADVRNLAIGGARYLLWRGDACAVADLARSLYDRWRVKLGENHLDTLASASLLAGGLYWLEELGAARELHEDTLARSRRMLGPDHSDTLIRAGNLGSILYMLGELGAARELHENSLAQQRRELGVDHPDTLMSALDLAADLYALGEFQEARELDEDTLERCRGVLGADHPETLSSANNLAGGLYWLGEFQAARELFEDTLERRRRVLGLDHPDTQQSAENLSMVLRKLE